MASGALVLGVRGAQKWKLRPTRPISSFRRCECTIVELGNATGLLLALVEFTVPRSTCRYSSLTDHLGKIIHSTPPPTVQPVWVPEVVARLNVPVPGQTAKSVNLASPTAPPPVT